MLIRQLLPSEDEIERMARLETDPSRASAFEPLALGPVPTALALVFVAGVAVLLAPMRLLVRFLRLAADR